ncbi:hypothetical protein LJK88_40055 [Paenibacillus sp. P26]|nr:hypothetical protein LJK88_40055 [Paenibacillus sp. P26]
MEEQVRQTAEAADELLAEREAELLGQMEEQARLAAEAANQRLAEREAELLGQLAELERRREAEQAEHQEQKRRMQAQLGEHLEKGREPLLRGDSLQAELDEPRARFDGQQEELQLQQELYSELDAVHRELQEQSGKRTAEIKRELEAARERNRLAEEAHAARLAELEQALQSRETELQRELAEREQRSQALERRLEQQSRRTTCSCRKAATSGRSAAKSRRRWRTSSGASWTSKKRSWIFRRSSTKSCRGSMTSLPSGSACRKPARGRSPISCRGGWPSWRGALRAARPSLRSCSVNATRRMSWAGPCRSNARRSRRAKARAVSAAAAWNAS